MPPSPNWKHRKSCHRRITSPPAALDGPLLHSNLVHPPKSTAKLSTFSTRPHIPCRRGRRRSQEGHDHVPSRRSPHRAWEPSKHPHDHSGQIGTPGSAGARAGPSLHSDRPLPSGNTAKLSTRGTTEPQITAGRNPDNWHHQGTHTYVAAARALPHRLRLISTDSRASHSEGKPS